MDNSFFNIKADDYEPDLYSDMVVQEEITVDSSDNMFGSYHQPVNVGHGFPGGGNTVSLVHNNSLPHQTIEMKPKPKVIFIKSNNNSNHINIGNNLRSINIAGNNAKQIKMIPISNLNQNNRLIRINQTVNASATNIGPNITRILNPQMLKNVQITKLNNFNMPKIGGNQNFVFQNRQNIPSQFGSATPINYIQATNMSHFNQPNTIMQPMNIRTSNQKALKLEAGDSGFYNLTGGTGPTRYYPRTNSPDKDSQDDSQEQMSNIYKTNGLRKYASSVCDKVKEKGTTTYSEVADELVHEYAAEHPMIPPDQLHYIQKNIRRRVYDALNVLMALKVLDKEKKEIKWKGLPVNLMEECKQLEEEKIKKSELLQQRIEELSELTLQLISYKNLVGRNRQKEKEGCAPPLNERIKLPFMVVSTNHNTVIDCNISPHKLDYLFTFDQAFEMQDEFQTLKQSGFTLRLGTSQCTESQYKRCLELVPNALRFYVEAIYQQRAAIVPDFVSLHRRNMAVSSQRSVMSAPKMVATTVTGGSNNNNGSWSMMHGHGGRSTTTTINTDNTQRYWGEHRDQLSSSSLSSVVRERRSGGGNHYYEMGDGNGTRHTLSHGDRNKGGEIMEEEEAKYGRSRMSHTFADDTNDDHDDDDDDGGVYQHEDIEVMDEDEDF